MDFFHFERKGEKLAGQDRFSQRIMRNGAAVLAVLLAALGIGMAGYSGFEGMNATDAFVNAAMILSGMGPLDPLRTEGGKIFAGVYAIFSGVLFIAVSALMLAPLFHRLLHRFHMDEDDRKEPNHEPERQDAVHFWRIARHRAGDCAQGRP